MVLLEEALDPLSPPADGMSPWGAAYGKGGSGEGRGGKDEQRAGEQDGVAGRSEAGGSWGAGEQAERRGSEAFRPRHGGQGKGP